MMTGDTVNNLGVGITRHGMWNVPECPTLTNNYGTTGLTSILDMGVAMTMDIEDGLGTEPDNETLSVEGKIITDIQTEACEVKKNESVTAMSEYKKVPGGLGTGMSDIL